MRNLSNWPLLGVFQCRYAWRPPWGLHPENKGLCVLGQLLTSLPHDTDVSPMGHTQAPLSKHFPNSPWVSMQTRGTDTTRDPALDLF